MLQGGDDKERRGSLRRLDDILDTLEQLNLHDRTELTEGLAESLVLLGVDSPYSIPIPQLIERVWAMQQPYLITIVVERRPRRPRNLHPNPSTPPAITRPPPPNPLKPPH